MKKMLKSAICAVCLVIGLTFMNMDTSNGIYQETYYEESYANAIVDPVITKIDTSGTDLVKLTLTKGSYDFDEIIFRDLSNIGNSIIIPLANNNTTQYASVRDGVYQVIIRDSSSRYTTFSTQITINTSCTNEVKSNVKGVVEFERCAKYYGVDGNATLEIGGAAPTCASGYVLKSTDYNDTITYNECASLDKSDLTTYGVSYRYCTMKFEYECVASTTDNSSNLASLSLSGMKPSFSPSTYSYSASTSSSSVEVNATLNNDGSSFVDGYGPRTVSLGYGTNNVLVKVKSSSGNITTYTIKVSRSDTRDTTNTVNSLNIGSTPFNETFNSNTNSYTVSVDQSVSEIFVNAELTSGNSSFLDGFGPRRVTLDEGVNAVYIKVKSESGSVRIYTIEVRRGESEEVVENKIYLKNINIDTDDDSIVLKPDFKEDIFQYNLTVPNDVTILLIKATADDNDHEVVIEGNKDYVVGDNLVKIIVTDPETEQNRVYEIHVNRLEKNLEIDTDSSLKNLEIEGYDIKFNAETTTYNIKLKEGSKELSIIATPNSERSSIEIIDNVDLKVKSEVIVRVNAEDGTFTDYKVFIEGIDSGTNMFLIVIIVLIIVLALVYLVLRMLGYRIVINTDMFKSMFKGKSKKK